MKNREQIRARNALQALEDYPELKREEREGGDHLTGFPALIVNNGLLAAVAFSLMKGGDYVSICEAIATHLADAEIGLLPKNADVKGMQMTLVKEDSEKLRLCTAEALTFLNYLRRFAKAEA